MEVLRRDLGRIGCPSQEQRMKSPDQTAQLPIKNAVHLPVEDILQPMDLITSPLPLSSNSLNGRTPLYSFTPLHPPGENQALRYSGQGGNGGRDSHCSFKECERDKTEFTSKKELMRKRESLSPSVPQEFSKSSCLWPHQRQKSDHDRPCDLWGETEYDDESGEGGFYQKSKKPFLPDEKYGHQQQQKLQQRHPYHHHHHLEESKNSESHRWTHYSSDPYHSQYPHQNQKSLGASEEDQLWTNERILDRADLIAVLRHEIKTDLREFLKELQHQEQHKQLQGSSKTLQKQNTFPSQQLSQQQHQDQQQQQQQLQQQQLIQRPFAICASSRSSSRLPSPLQPVNPAPPFGPTNRDLYETHLFTQL